MHIGSRGIVRKSLYADFCGYNWTTARNGPGRIIAYKDGGTLWLQGEDAEPIEHQLADHCSRPYVEGVADDYIDDCNMLAVDMVLSQYGRRLVPVAL